MRFYGGKIIGILLLLIGIALPGRVYSNLEEIIIVDVNQITRASSVVERSGSIEFSLTDPKGDPADGVEVLLKNMETGEVIKRTSISGLVVFNGIAPGIWEVSSTANWATFANVSITSGSVAAAAGGAGAGVGGGLFATGAGVTTQTALIGAGVVGATAGTAAYVEEQRDDGSSNDSPDVSPTPSSSASPKPSSTATPSPTPRPRPTTQPTSTPKPTPTPTPIEPSPFS
jgi:hypothetical protein